MIPWDELRVLLAIARRRSFGAAGTALGVDPTTVGRRLAALEEAVGTRLFERTTLGLVPSEAGLRLVQRAARVEDEVLAAERELLGHDERATGTVRITAGDGTIHELLVPALPALRRAHPGLVVELRADIGAVDLSRREADVAVRLSRPKEPALVATRLGVMRFAFYASSSYLERHEMPRSAGDLAEHDLIGYDESGDAFPQVRWLHRQVTKPRWVIRASTTTAQALACAEGLGIALLGTVLAKRDRRLVPIAPALRPPPRDAWVVYHRDLRKNARVSATVSWLRTIELDA